jgi:hypothetical protein
MAFSDAVGGDSTAAPCGTGYRVDKPPMQGAAEKAMAGPRVIGPAINHANLDEVAGSCA